MNTIKSGIFDEKNIVEALKGEYGTFDLSNGIRVNKSGRMVQYWGTFSNRAEVVEIPVLPERHPVTFSGDNFSCCSIAEANSGKIKVPSIARGKRFVVSAMCILNS